MDPLERNDPAAGKRMPTRLVWLLGLVFVVAIAAGVVDQTHSIFRATDGYRAMWPTVGPPVLVSLPPVWLLRGAEVKAGS